MAAREFEVIYRWFAGLGAGDAVALGVGDDAAILDLPTGCQMVVSTDTLVEGVHFLPETLPEDIAYRAVATAASDLAAMAAAPLGMTLALTLPEADDLWLHGFSQGLAAAVADTGLPLVGGDTTQGPLTLSVTVMGAVPNGQALLRSGARVGDRLWVTHTLGDAAAALAMLQGELADTWLPEFDHQDWLIDRFNRPTPRLDFALGLRGRATACIDISDGLLADARHIADASGVALHIDAQLIPLSAVLIDCPNRELALRWALTGGDDYELLFTLPPGLDAPPECTLIGEVRAGLGVHCDHPAANPGAGGHLGYAHFH